MSENKSGEIKRTDLPTAAEAAKMANDEMAGLPGGTSFLSDGENPLSLANLKSYEERAKLHDRLSTDPVTGLNAEYPLRDLVNGLQERWEKDRAIQGTFIVADFKNLHKVNDEYGKLMGGNDGLCAVADILIKLSRNSGRCFRAGGDADEFVLYFPEFQKENEVNLVLDKIDNELQIKETEYQAKYPGIKLGLSYCVAAFNDKLAPTEAYEKANNEMGRAKQMGRILLNLQKDINQHHE